MWAPIDLDYANDTFRGVVHHRPCPDWASGTRSLMILQASYTGVDGSNCMVFTTLHCRTQIFSDNATILVESLGRHQPAHLTQEEDDIALHKVLQGHA